MSGQDEIIKLIRIYKRRLQKLRERQALSGLNTPPEVFIEIEDLESEISKLQAEIGENTRDLERLINVHKRRLLELKKHQALYGLEVDPSISIEIEEIEHEIAKLQQSLADASDLEISVTDSIRITGSSNVVLDPATLYAAGTVRFLNPYAFGVPIRSSDRFFGREEELQLIFKTLEQVPRGQKQDMVIVGPRRVGKSSILLRLLNIHPDDFLPVYIDLQKVEPRHPRTLFLTILHEIQRMNKYHQLFTELPAFETVNSNTIPADLQFLTFSEDMECLNQTIAQRNLPRLILMFDEVELLTEFGGISTLEWFRSLIQSLGYCVFIVAGSDQLYKLTSDYTSPFYNIFKIIEIGPLSPDAADLLVRQPAATVGLVYPSSEVKRILHYTGRNPYFIQAMGHYLIELLNNEGRTKIQAGDADIIAAQLIDRLAPQFSYYWGNCRPVEQGLLYLLAQQPEPQTAERLTSKFFDLTGVHLRSTQRQILANLTRQQVLVLSSTAGKPAYRFAIQLFADWVRQKINEEEIRDQISIRP